MICALIASTGWAQQADWVSEICQGYQSNQYLAALVECSQNSAPDAYPSLSASKVKTATIVIFVLALVAVLVIFLIHIFARLRTRKTWTRTTRIVGWSRLLVIESTSQFSVFRLLWFYWWSLCLFSPSLSLLSSGNRSCRQYSVIGTQRTRFSPHRMAIGKLKQVQLVQLRSVIRRFSIHALNLFNVLGIRSASVCVARHRCDLSFPTDRFPSEAASPTNKSGSDGIVDQSMFSWCSFVFLIYIQRKRKKSKENARRKRRQSSIVHRILFIFSLWRIGSVR